MALAWGSAIYGNGVCSLSTTSRSTREPRLVYRALLPAKDSDSTDSRDQKDHTLQKYELSTNISRGLAAHLAHSLRLLKPHGTCGSHQTRWICGNLTQQAEGFRRTASSTRSAPGAEAKSRVQTLDDRPHETHHQLRRPAQADWLRLIGEQSKRPGAASEIGVGSPVAQRKCAQTPISHGNRSADTRLRRTAGIRFSSVCD